MGGLTVHGLHAQAKAPAYDVAEVEVLDEGAMREFGPKAAALTQAHGGKYSVRGRNIAAIEGASPKIVVVVQFESIEKIQAYRNSPDYKAIDDLSANPRKSVPTRSKGSTELR